MMAIAELAVRHCVGSAPATVLEISSGQRLGSAEELHAPSRAPLSPTGLKIANGPLDLGHRSEVVPSVFHAPAIFRDVFVARGNACREAR